MNRSPSGLKPDKAILGFMQHKTAEGLSTGTLVSTEYFLKTWPTEMGEVAIEVSWPKTLSVFGLTLLKYLFQSADYF